MPPLRINIPIERGAIQISESGEIRGKEILILEESIDRTISEKSQRWIKLVPISHFSSKLDLHRSFQFIP